jgi:hypothetical protein
LGVTIRLDDYGGADERLIRVLEVEPSSPAAICGLVENQDYLLGTTGESFDSVNTLAQVLQAHVDRVVEVYVYNTDSDVVRVVALMPTYAWGGNGLLGAEVATGYLHRLPKSCRDTIGSSVERKVRWVGMKPVHPSQKEGSLEEATLEVEPQLEMEVVDENHEEMHKTVQQVADHGNGTSRIKMAPPMKESNDDASPVQETATVASRGGKSAAECSVEASDSGVSAPPEFQSQPAEAETPPQATSHTQQESEPSAQTNMRPPPPPVDAAALFSAPPPPPGANASYASQFMPPPPMSYLSRDKEGEVDLR